MDDQRQPVLLKVEDVAALLNIGRMTAYEMCHAESGLKPYTVRIGSGKRGLRVTRDGLMQWLWDNQGRIDEQDFRERGPVELRSVSGGRG